MNSMNYTFGHFNDTFLFSFGFVGTELSHFDSLNNPYLDFLSFEYFVNDRGNLDIRKDYEIDNCPLGHQD